MGKVIPLELPELSEDQAAKILENVSSVCMPLPKAQMIASEIEMIAYRFQRNSGMTASQLIFMGYPHAKEHEKRYELEALDGVTGGSDGTL